MTPATTAFAVRLHGQDFALEPGREYLLGAGDDCDLRLPLAGPRHLALRVDHAGVHFEDLRSGHGTWRGEERVECGVLAAEASLRLGREIVQFVLDDGSARIVPDPALRRRSRERRLAAALAQARHRRAPETFAELMAEELGRAPWLGLSLVGHALVVLLLWLLLPAPAIGGRAKATVDVHLSPDLAGERDQAAQVLEVQDESTSPLEQLADDLPNPPDEPAVDTSPFERTNLADALGGNPAVARRRSGGALGGGDLSGIGSGGFRKAVGELRQSGLEIVFVFDSTGSMTRTIHETKQTITGMLDVLRALVPDARIGLVTYRDRGPREDYATQGVPLGLDYWRAVNFVQQVLAEGGGDRPEAVRDGLEVAFGQGWRTGARRVIVLAGDAPPHPEDIQPLLRRVKAFAKDGRSFVHTLLTSPQLAGPDTRDVFHEIAAAGRGHSVALGDRDRILQQVLELAIGREFDADLAAVTAAVMAEQERMDTRTLDLARRGGDELRRELSADPVDATLLHALVRLPKKHVYRELIAMLQDERTPAHTLQALGWVLQKTMNLPLPPADPLEPRKLNLAMVERLRWSIERLPE